MISLLNNSNANGSVRDEVGRIAHLLNFSPVEAIIHVGLGSRTSPDVSGRGAAEQRLCFQSDEFHLDSIRVNLTADVFFCCWALLRLYDRQSVLEQHMKRSIHRNRKGFNAPDARALDKYIEMARAGILRPEAHRFVGPRLQKYAGQLLCILRSHHG